MLVQIKNIKISKEVETHSIDLNINEKQMLRHGFHFGDSIDISFSNGILIKDVPYFNGFYIANGLYILISYFGYKNIQFKQELTYDLWKKFKLTNSHTASITLHKKQKYAATQKALDLDWTKNRNDYTSDEEFANFRRFPNKVNDFIFRSSSIINNRYGRISYVNKIASSNNITWILNVSDSLAVAKKYIKEFDIKKQCPYFYKLFISNPKHITFANSSVNIGESADCYVKLIKAIIKGRSNGQKHRFLVHCTEGKDRTGAFAIMLESLAGCTYDEMFNDYIQSFYNYYHLDKKKDFNKIQLIHTIYFGNLLRVISGKVRQTSFKEEEIRESVEQYLLKGGLTSKELKMFISIIKAPKTTNK